jgi:hypothetical protein
VAIVAIGHVWGVMMMDEGRNIVHFTPPLLGGYREVLPPRLWMPAIVAAAGVAVLPVLARKLAWPALLPTFAGAALLWWVVLAFVDGPGGLTRGLDWDYEFGTIVGRAGGDPSGFLRGFVTDLGSYSVQVKGHPPGLPLFLGALERVGLHGAGWAAGVILVVGASMVPAVLITTRAVADEGAARSCAPFLVLAPTALWLATSIDTLFVGVTAWSITLVILAMRRDGRSSDLLAAAAGLLAGGAVLLSYGLVLVALPPLGVALAWRRWRPLLVAAAAAVAVVLALAPLGFWWPAGLLATRHEYYSLDLDRPYGYFFVNNLAAWALALGPATVVGLALLRDRRLWLLVGGGVAAAGFANVSGLSEGEVERIWMPFTVWVLPAAAVLGLRGRATRAWLLAQAGSALAITAVVGTLW